jgi:hypothetical protein
MLQVEMVRANKKQNKWLRKMPLKKKDGKAQMPRSQDLGISPSYLFSLRSCYPHKEARPRAHAVVHGTAAGEGRAGHHAVRALVADGEHGLVPAARRHHVPLHLADLVGDLVAGARVW